MCKLTMRRLNLSFIFLILFFGCSTERPSGKTEAEVLYQEAQELMKDERYLLAIEKLNSIRSQYPYSYYATHAELLNADVLYSQENYAEAAAAYIVFKDFHPKHKQMAYVVFRISESFYKQIPSTFDRDLTPAVEAIKYYQELLRVYPGSDFVKDAQEKITSCQNMIEDKERYIADFYFKTDVFDSARFRYLSIVKNSIQNKRIRDHSMVRILLASSKLNEKESCKEYYAKYKGIIAKDYSDDLDDAYSDCIK